MYGIYINDSESPFTDWIFEKWKLVETRNSHTLDCFIGQRVGIIRTGCGKPTLVGYVDIVSVREYKTFDDWFVGKLLHRVPLGTRYDFKSGKCGYLLANPERCHAQVLESIKGNRIYREL